MLFRIRNCNEREPVMFSISVASADERETAFSLLFSHLPDDERATQTVEILDAVRNGEFPPEGLLIAQADGELVGTVLYAVQPDNTAFVWPPAARDGLDGHTTVRDGLLKEVCRRIDALGCLLGQAIVEPHRTGVNEILSHGGFEHVADLEFLHRQLDAPLPSQPASDFETVAFDPATNYDRFARLVERTYVDTLDCPSFSDNRTGAEALDSHRTAGTFDPQCWKIYRKDDKDIGVLLLSDHPREDVWEVVYMGIVPEDRGRGYGRGMLICGLHEAHAAGRNSLMLAVDSRNHYACSVYDDLGFVEITRRSAYVRMHPDRRGSR